MVAAFQAFAGWRGNRETVRTQQIEVLDRDTGVRARIAGIAVVDQAIKPVALRLDFQGDGRALTGGAVFEEFLEHQLTGADLATYCR